MKKHAFIAVILVLTVSLLAGCGCTARDSGMATMPSADQPILPTNIPETTIPTEAATLPETIPATAPTDETEYSSNEATDDGTANVPAETGMENRSRMR